MLCESTSEGPSTIPSPFLLGDRSSPCTVVGLCFGVTVGPDNGEGLKQSWELKMKVDPSSMPTAMLSLNVCERHASTPQSSPFCAEGGGLTLLVN